MGGAPSSLTTIVTPTYTFTGQTKNNQMSGFGTQHFSDGTVYVGEFKEDKFHGKGSFWNGKDTLKGEFIEGKLNKPNANYVDQKTVDQFNEMLETQLNFLKLKEIEKSFEVIGKTDTIEGKITKKQEIQVDKYQAKECKQNIPKQTEYIDPEIFKYIEQLEKQRDDTANKYKQLYDQMISDQAWYQDSIKKLCNKREMQQNQLKDKIPVKDQKFQDQITKIDDDCQNSEAISTQSKNNSIIKRADENIPRGECSIFFPNGNVLTGNLAGHTITNPAISFKNGDVVVITAGMKIKSFILEILNQNDSLKLIELTSDQKQLVKQQPENLVLPGNNSTRIYYPNGNVLTGTLKGNCFENVFLTFKNKETVLICQEVRIKNETVFKVIDKQFFDQSIKFKDDEIPRMQIGLGKTQQKCMISYFNGSSVQGQYSNGLIYDIQIFFKNGDKVKSNECIQVNSAALKALNQKTWYQKTDFDKDTNSKVQVCDIQFLNEHSTFKNLYSVLYPNGNTLIGQLENGALTNAILKFKNDDAVKILEPITIKSSAAFKLLQSVRFDSGLLEEVEFNRVSQIEIKSDAPPQPQSNIKPSSSPNFMLNMKSISMINEPKEETKTENDTYNGEQNSNQGNDQKLETDPKINSDLNAQNKTTNQEKQENGCKTEIENEGKEKSEANAVQKQDMKVNDQNDEKEIIDEKEQQHAPENQQMNLNNCQKDVNESNDGKLALNDEIQVTTTKSEQTQDYEHKTTGAIQPQEVSVETGKQQVLIQNAPIKETDSNCNTQPKHCVQDSYVNKEENIDVSKKCMITYNGNSVQGQINGNTIEDLQISFKNGDKAKLKDIIVIYGAILNQLNQKDKYNRSDYCNDTNNKVQICDKQFNLVDNCSVLYPNGNILTGQLEKGILSNPILHFKNDAAVKIQESITINCTALFKMLGKDSFDSGLLEEFEFSKVFQIEIKGDTPCEQDNSKATKCENGHQNAPNNHNEDQFNVVKESKPDQDKQQQSQAPINEQKDADNSNQCDIQAKQLQINKDSQISNQLGDAKTNQTAQVQQQNIYLPTSLVQNALCEPKAALDNCKTQIDSNIAKGKQEELKNQEIPQTDNSIKFEDLQKQIQSPNQKNNQDQITKEMNIAKDRQEELKNKDKTDNSEPTNEQKILSAQEKPQEKQTEEKFEEEKVQNNENGQSKETLMNVPVLKEPVKDQLNEAQKELIDKQKGTNVQQQVQDDGKPTKPLNGDDESSSVTIEIGSSSDDE
ncbi:MORN_motif [Hexamita inflata]|uniref:MORN motif n=1 Tax=Hexamita inflata TaxID=28002 RepID=A0AA86RN50_9EUKA|nr:MORN motif [Hexamita inflata]